MPATQIDKRQQGLPLGRGRIVRRGRRRRDFAVRARATAGRLASLRGGTKLVCEVMSAAETLQAGPILLYDGGCGVCSEAVQWVLRHERQHSLRFAPLEGPVGSELRSLAGVSAQVDSVLWVEWRAGRVRAQLRSSALLQVLTYVGGPWRLFAILRVVPSFVRDACYRAFANVRYRVRAPACLVPTPNERARFIQAEPQIR